jgi:hypothetical protein
MKSFFTLLIAILLTGSFAYSQSSDIKALISDLPSEMIAGQTYTVTVTITNNSTGAWNSEKFKAKFYGKFTVTNPNETVFVLQPGESTNKIYNVTAPSTTGRYKIKVIIYNGERKVALKSRTVKVISGTDPENK